MVAPIIGWAAAKGGGFVLSRSGQILATIGLGAITDWTWDWLTRS